MKRNVNQRDSQSLRVETHGEWKELYQPKVECVWIYGSPSRATMKEVRLNARVMLKMNFTL